MDLREDYFQEGALGVVKAMTSFIPSKGNLDHYATRCAHGRMLNYRRALFRWTNEVSVGLLEETDPEEERIPAAYSRHCCSWQTETRCEGRRIGLMR